MAGQLSPGERVERALRFEDVDHVPFTVYECMIPQCEAERIMRNEGLCIHQRRPSVYATRSPGITSETHTYVEDGRSRTRTIIHTPEGDLTEVREPADFTSWHLEKPFKCPDDYQPLIAMIDAQQYVPNYGAWQRMSDMMGGDAVMRGGIGYSPLQHIIHRLMGVEVFAVEWAERRDEVLTLYEALVENRRRLYPICAQSPCQYFNYGGNVSPEIVGEQRFREYYVPHYEEFAEVMHAAGKLVGVHFDANTRLIADAIAETSLDYIEAFSPAPDTDMSVADARAAWPDKVLWINYPSSVFLRSDEEMEQVTIDLLRQAAPGNGFLIGITEDMPPDRWIPGCMTITRTVREHGRLPVGA
ncbi:MAG: uroporphyrinogen decarboxylase family protein [Armatimonadota bacterium]